MVTKTKRQSPPLALRSDYDELLPIGTRVHFTHRAGIARYKKLWNDGYDKNYAPLTEALKLEFEQTKAPKGWKIIDGVYPGEYSGEKDPFRNYPLEPLRLVFAKYPQAKFGHSKANKTIMIWPEDSFGWIIGITRKGIGESSPSHYYRGGYYEAEFEQGYLILDMYIDLYVVKQFYDGVQYIYCPMWAVNKVEDDAS